MRDRTRRTRRAAWGLWLLLVPFLVPALLQSSVAESPEAERVEETERDLQRSLSDFASAQGELASALEELTLAEARLESTKSEIRRIASRMLKREEALIEIAEEMYKSGSGSLLTALLSAGTLGELEERLSYLSASERVHTEELQSFANDAALLEERLGDLRTVRSEAAGLVERVKAIEERLEQEVAARRGALARAEGALARAEAAAEAEALRAALAEAEAAEERAREVSATPAADRGPYSVNWDAIAECESGGNWQARGQYHGGLQFHPQTWLGYGGGEFARYAYEASRAEQITVAERVLDGQGPGAWPHCFQYG